MYAEKCLKIVDKSNTYSMRNTMRSSFAYYSLDLLTIRMRVSYTIPCMRSLSFVQLACGVLFVVCRDKEKVEVVFDC